MMRPEDVPTEWVEKAARAKYDADPYRRPDGSPWPWEELDLADIQEIRTETRHALAAVLPEIQAQAWQPFLDLRQRAESAPFEALTRDSVVRNLDAALRAARLIATTEEPTDA